jgi:N-dimethylarginine dimethylaminohydrolase
MDQISPLAAATGLAPCLVPRLAPATLPRPSFLLCPPFAHEAAVPNNVWMREYADGDGVVDPVRSMDQFLELYHFLAAESLVYLLPAPPEGGLQDQVFVANLGFIPQFAEAGHTGDPATAIIANFTSEPRRGETEHGVRFFQALGHRAVVPPYRFEGEAELKHLHGNIYVGGYGERSDRRLYDWMAEQFGMNIIAVEERNEYFYHLDCSLFPLSREETIICTSQYTSAELKALSQVTDIIDVTEEEALHGICNSVRLNNLVLNASHLHDLKPGHEHWQPELQKNRKLEDICAARGMEPVFFNLSEYFKSGALLSCMVMHLNRRSYDIRII